MANEKTPVVWDDTTKKHRPLGTGEKMGGLSASSLLSSDSGNLITTGSDGLAYLSGSGIADPAAGNLLETTAQGKLKMDVDRLAEWLDGHSSDASALADAINVVSADSGNIITKGSDKGAYLSSASLANAFAGMSAAQLQQLAAALADGTTIVASGGKLTVDPTSATAAQLTKISAAIRKSGGGLSVGADGKLSVDFASMDPAIMRAVVLSMVQPGGGISVDQNGQLYVDFDSMPTDKFEAMLKSLKMLVPLGANKHLYVNKGSSAASDTIDEDRGTQAKPFKTIQACVDYLTANYSLGAYNAYIHVVANTYSENVTLPDYSHGSGTIYLMSDSGSRDVVIKSVPNLAGFVGSAVHVTGGQWTLIHLSLERTEVAYTGPDNYVGMCLEVTGDTAIARLRGCRFVQAFPSDANLPGTQYAIRVIGVDNNATVTFYPYDIATSFTFSDTATHDRNTDVISISRGSKLRFERPVVTDAISGYSWDIACSGSCDNFIHVWQGASVNTIGGGPAQTFSGTVVGRRFLITQGSFIYVGQNDDYFPGDTAGIIDNGEGGRPQTYCWYA